MPTDDLIAEVRAIREAYAARFGFDLLAMVRDLRERKQAGGRVVLPPPEGADCREELKAVAGNKGLKMLVVLNTKAAAKEAEAGNKNLTVLVNGP